MTFLEHISAVELGAILKPHMGLPAWPGLTDATVKARARTYLIETGRWQKLGAEFDPCRPLVSFRRSLYRDYQRTGNRDLFEIQYRKLTGELDAAVLALWLDHPDANLDHAQDLIWSICEMTNWNLPAHQAQTLELTSTAVGLRLAEYGFILAGRLETEVQQRIDQELEHRMLQPALNPAHADWWQTGENNWNHVCNANLMGIAFYQIKEVNHLAAFMHAIVSRLGYGIDGFTDDGGCVEGPGYWDYGFSHFVDAALMLKHRTGGAINLMTVDPKIERICRYPMAVYLRSPLRTTFSDSADGLLAAGTILRVLQFFPITELLSLVECTNDGRHLSLRGIRDLSLYRDEHPSVHDKLTDCLLPDLGLAKVYAGDPSVDVVLAVVAGNNGVSHNHNDLGSFIACKRGNLLLTDPGVPVYNARTFGPDRYEILVCRSRGHSVPLINGHEQCEGAEFSAKLTVENLNAVRHPKVVIADLTHSYPDPTLSSFVRRWVLSPDGALKISDAFVFTEIPSSLEEAFLTYVEVEILSDDQGVRLREADVEATLRAETSGKFDLETFSHEEHGGRMKAPLHRLRFNPDRLDLEMTLSFTLT